MLQKANKKYTVETLKPLNVMYDHEHWLTQQDVDRLLKNIKSFKYLVHVIIVIYLSLLELHHFKYL